MAKKKLCEFCEPEFTKVESMDNNNLTMEVYPGKMISAVAFFFDPKTEETYEATVSIPMDFCPVCGRRLGE